MSAMLRLGSTAQTVKAIQGEALLWAASKIVAAGNPALAQETIILEAERLLRE
jgi:hypothetical protein